MRIKFTRAWGPYAAGDVIAPPAALRQRLILTGFAAPAGDHEPARAPEPDPDADRPRARRARAPAPMLTRGLV